MTLILVGLLVVAGIILYFVSVDYRRRGRELMIHKELFFAFRAAITNWGEGPPAEHFKKIEKLLAEIGKNKQEFFGSFFSNIEKLFEFLYHLKLAYNHFQSAKSNAKSGSVDDYVERFRDEIKLAKECIPENSLIGSDLTKVMEEILAYEKEGHIAQAKKDLQHLELELDSMVAAFEEFNKLREKTGKTIEELGVNEEDKPLFYSLLKGAPLQS